MPIVPQTKPLLRRIQEHLQELRITHRNLPCSSIIDKVCEEESNFCVTTKKVISNSVPREKKENNVSKYLLSTV